MAYLAIIIFAIFLIGFVAKAVSVLKKSRQIKEQGIETEAVISRIEYDPEDSSYFYYVTYKDESGLNKESALDYGRQDQYVKGQKIIVRYLPSDDELVLFVRKIDE